MGQTAIEEVSGIFAAALEAVSPYDAADGYCEYIETLYKNGNFNRLIVTGFGKAACPMAKAIEDCLKDIIAGGIIIAKYNNCNKYAPVNMRIVEAGHPLPDKQGINGTEEVIGLLEKADGKTLVACLISGGGSALLVAPYPGVTLCEKQKTTDLILKAGADISELNAVRKHISRVKGGRLAEIAHPARTVSLILSDVIGDRLDVIASGPTSPDKTTYKDALEVLKKYSLSKEAPTNVLDILYRGLRGTIPETPKENDIIFKGVENIIVGSNRKAIEAAKRRADDLSLHTEIISDNIAGEARDAGTRLAETALVIHNTWRTSGGEKVCLISGGETTVTVNGTGTGGRNMELALAFAMKIEGYDGITLLSAGTDGTDGPTDATGAIVDGETAKKARAIGLDPAEYIKNNDSYNFFKQVGGLFITGPTGTNVMDMQIMVIG
jgi:glycerate 2-kinase